MTDSWKLIPIFNDLKDEELFHVQNIFRKISVRSGTNIISEGEEGHEMFILVDGKVKISKAMLMKGMSIPLLEMENPRKVLASLDDSTFPVFGEIALIDNDHRSATVTVVEDSDFLITDREKFFALIEKHPAIGNKLLLTIGKRLAATVRKNNGELVKLTTALALALSRTR
ncbi:cyclic nucleotide-binding domain-containing protein [Maridesulfovibrio ferrireducens]|uniref:cyclic nucleotide-binding domain-containing protein n=1 Tax=Maridesulfovibrio ferrireducens TaxID=246191 RepID=UPI001A2952B1|nr:cyclic nucleotide-binding domain-containing protein [Maridesulfovibrio ferrireducens]MBI9111111.1 cyclic nucleotide-binding domain-containing protein [Maridesulfovibrio ferrireducens]